MTRAFTLRLDDALADRIASLAERDLRSVNAEIIYLLLLALAALEERNQGR